MTAGKVGPTDGLATGAVSSTAEQGQVEGITVTSPKKEPSASDGPGIIHCK
jgi:hypothetical protein